MLVVNYVPKKKPLNEAEASADATYSVIVRRPASQPGALSDFEYVTFKRGDNYLNDEQAEIVLKDPAFKDLMKQRVMRVSRYDENLEVTAEELDRSEPEPAVKPKGNKKALLDG